MTHLQKVLFQRWMVYMTMATCVPVIGKEETKRLCCELVEAIDDEIEGLDEAASTTKEK